MTPRRWPLSLAAGIPSRYAPDCLVANWRLDYAGCRDYSDRLLRVVRSVRGPAFFFAEAGSMASVQRTGDDGGTKTVGPGGELADGPPRGAIAGRRSRLGARWTRRFAAAVSGRGPGASRHLLFETLENRALLATYYVSPIGSDSNSSPGTLESPFRTIQRGLNTAKSPGDIVEVREGVYRERIQFPSSGSVAGGPITLRAYADEKPVIDVEGIEGATEDVVTIRNVSNVVFQGFEIINNTTADSGAAIFVTGSGSNIVIRDNVMHDLRGTSSMGIAVYGTAKVSLNRVTIDNNHIFDAEPAPSEAVAINGNVENFVVSNNLIHDINNIGIDVIGGETDINPRQVARNGVVRGNTVYNAHSSYGDGFAAGIYVDGGRNIVVENNTSYSNDLGLEVGAENKGFDSVNITVRNNLIYDNDKAGLVFGGYAANVGRTRGSFFINNTVYGNDTLGTGFGQLWVQFASGNTVANNLFVAGEDQALVYNEVVNPSNAMDSNMYWAPSGSANTSFLWNNVEYPTFADYQRKSRQDKVSFFADPLFADAAEGEFQLQAGSPAVDRGTNTRGRFAPTDFAGTARTVGARPDLGAFEQTPVTPALQRIVAPVGPDDLYHGVYPGGKTGFEDDITAADIAAYETAAGKQAAWVYFSHNWYENRLFPAGTAAMIRDRGSIPYIRLMLRSSTQENKAEPTFTLTRLLRGEFDNDLRAWARSARDFASPLIVEFGPEMNGSWFSWNGTYNGGSRAATYGDPTLPDGPERFRDAYRRIINVMREAGAANITWVFHVNAQDWPSVPWNRFENYYPGDSFIDWLGVSVYGAQTPRATSWPAFRDIMDAAYPRLDALAANKPIVVSEFGVTSNNPLGSAATWATDAWTDLKAARWPRVIGASWWNERWKNDEIPAHDTTMRLQDNAPLRTAFAAEVAASTVIARPLFEDIVTTQRPRSATALAPSKGLGNATQTATPNFAATAASSLTASSPTAASPTAANPTAASPTAALPALVLPASSGASAGSSSVTSSGATSSSAASPSANGVVAATRSMVRSFTARTNSTTPTLAELAQRVAATDDVFARIGGV
jgi:hypothetical protein